MASIAANPCSTGTMMLYDDGTHGDKTAGDGTYTLAKITSTIDVISGVWTMDGMR